MFVQIPRVTLSDPNKNNNTDGDRKALKAVVEKQLYFLRECLHDKWGETYYSLREKLLVSIGMDKL